MIWAAVPGILFFFLFLIAPRLFRRDMRAFLGRPYAHRGLWDPTHPENSLSAFQQAVKAGFGIELDVQATKDGVLIVFHDETLKRVFGRPEALRDLTYPQLQSLCFPDSQESIPRFQDVLSSVDGQVPMIIEIKTGKRIFSLCRDVADMLSAYTGPYLIESFDPRVLLWYRLHHPSVLRGQLSYGLCRGTPYRRCLSNRLFTSLIGNVLARPDFLAYDIRTERSLPLRLQRLFRPWLVAWTVTDPAQLADTRIPWNMYIFEGYRPPN